MSGLEILSWNDGKINSAATLFMTDPRNKSPPKGSQSWSCKLALEGVGSVLYITLTRSNANFTC